jgi:uncharacterized cupin superfamily protein
MVATDRPSWITHWSEIEEPDKPHYKGYDELLPVGSPFGRHFGLQRLGIHHQRLAPGRRTSFPHAESAEEEFVYVIEGTPDVWLDGHLHRLQPGDGVGFPAGTGIAHTFLNNTDTEVRLLVVGEAMKSENRIFYPFHRERRATIPQWWWDDPPAREMGEHDGMTDALRARKAAQKT